MDGITLYGFAAQGKYLCLSYLLSEDVVTHFLIAHEGGVKRGKKQKVFRVLLNDAPCF